MSGDLTDARILAALRALPPETVADVREAAGDELDRASGWKADSPAHMHHCAAAARLTALADRLDAVREVPRG